MKYLYFICFFLICSGQTVLGQKKGPIIYESIDIIYLKDGSFLKGKVINETKYLVTFNMLGDNEVRIQKKLIKKTVKGLDGHYYLAKGQLIKSAGMYGTVGLSSGWSQSRWSIAELSGVHLNASAGKMINEKYAVGIGTGLDVYAGPNWTTYGFIPLYAEARAYPIKSKISPYYALAMGIGIPVDVGNEFGEGEYFKTGWLIKPTIGLRFANKRNINYFLEMGYRFQKTKSHYAKWRWVPGTGETTSDIYDEVITFRRVHFTAGLLF